MIDTIGLYLCVAWYKHITVNTVSAHSRKAAQKRGYNEKNEI